MKTISDQRRTYLAPHLQSFLEGSLGKKGSVTVILFAQKKDTYGALIPDCKVATLCLGLLSDMSVVATEILAFAEQHWTVYDSPGFTLQVQGQTELSFSLQENEPS